MDLITQLLTLVRDTVQFREPNLCLKIERLLDAVVAAGDQTKDGFANLASLERDLQRRELAIVGDVLKTIVWKFVERFYARNKNLTIMSLNRTTEFDEFVRDVGCRRRLQTQRSTAYFKGLYAQHYLCEMKTVAWDDFKLILCGFNDHINANVI
nr:hp [Calliteara abietis nucleopolyhedrovirus]